MYFSSFFCFLIIFLTLGPSPQSQTSASNILFYIGPLASYSHRFGLEPLAIRLADLGHNVTIISAVQRLNFKPGDPHPHPNIREICPPALYAMNKNAVQDFTAKGLNLVLKGRELITPSLILDVFTIIRESCEKLLRSDEIQKFIKHRHRHPFHLIIMDNAMNDCVYALAEKLKSKTISYTSVSPSIGWDYDFYGIPHESSWFPILGTIFEGTEMPLGSRILNTFSSLAWYFLLVHYTLPQLEPICRQALDLPEMDSLEILKKQEKLMLINQHFSDGFARSLPPFVIPVGGMHLKDRKGGTRQNLPKYLNDFIGAPHGAGAKGFIYVSFGSAVSISTAPPHILTIFFEAFRKMRHVRFLWKWEAKEPPKNILVPPNVLLKPWFPQADVLAHPKILGFITQGGQVSHQEAIFNGIPLVVIPVFADQHVTAIRTRVMGNGVDLRLHGLTSIKLVEAIQKILTNQSYTGVAKRLAKMSRDRSISPLETAVWWTEFVLRHDDTILLRPLSSFQPWWKTRLVDVWGVTFSIVLVLLTGICWLAYRSVRRFVKFMNKFWFTRIRPAGEKKKGGKRKQKRM